MGYTKQYNSSHPWYLTTAVLSIIYTCIGEEGKIEMEPKKILGKLVISEETGEPMIEFADLKVSAMVHRVPVMYGHTISVSL